MGKPSGGERGMPKRKIVLSEKTVPRTILLSSRFSPDKLLDRIFPNIGFRPFWLTLLSVLCLVAYRYHGRRQACPELFIAWSQKLTGIDVVRFHEYGWSHLSALVLLMLAPLLVCRMAGMHATDLGLSFRQAGREFILVLALWASFLPVVWVLSGTEAFSSYYPRLPQTEQDGRLFFAYEGYYLLKWIAWEFFFRGFMLFGFKKDFGTRAVLISTIPFILMHFGKPEAEVFGSVAAGFVLCWIALRSNSIWPGVALHWLVATSLDFFASTWWR